MEDPSVMDLLPLRYPFLMIDRVLEMGQGRAVALKNVSHDEWFFVGHFPDRPIMPGTLLIEGMAQTAGLLLGRDANRPQGFLVGVDRARFRKQVVPGDQIIYEAELIKSRGGMYRVEVEARVDGERVAEAALTLMSASYEGEGG